MKRNLQCNSLRFTFFLVFAFFANLMNAQVTYVSSPVFSGGNPGGTTFAETSTTGWTVVPGLAGSLSANAWSSPVTIPFAFDFYGTPVTDFVVSANGLLTFTTSVVGTPPNANGPLPDASLPNNTIAVLWDEFTSAPPTGSNDLVYTQTFGTAPNRQLWVYWFSYEYGNPSVSFQYNAAVLEETTNKVYVVDVYGSATPSLTATVGVQKDATTAVMFGSNVSQNGNGTTNTDNEYYEFTPILLINDNAGILSIDAPSSPLTVGTQNVDVTLKNYGLNDLDTVTIYWTVNGTPQTPYGFSGPLAYNATTSLTIGTYNFVAGTTDIEVWTSMPNNTIDNESSNDSAMVSLCTSLSGLYTIGGVGADYADVSDAIAALNSCGVSAPVTFNITAGTYTGPYVLNEVVGASGVNTITFDGGSAATTILTHNSVGQYSTIELNGADHIIFQNLTIENTGTANAWGIHFWNQADSNTVNNCIVIMDNTVTTTTVVPIIATNSTTGISSTGNNANYTTISNTVVNGGYYGVRFYGNTSAATDQTNNTILNCTFNDVYAYGLFMYYQDNPIAIGNTVNGTRSATGYGINFSNSRHGEISGNTITDMNTYGIYMLTVNGTAQSNTDRSLVANNMVTAIGTGDGFYMTSSTDVDVFFNSFTAENDQALWLSTTATTYDIRNNIFVASGSSQVVDLDATPAASTGNLNYNIYFHSGGGDLAIVGATTYTTFADWQTGDPTQNVNSLGGDPSFVGPSDLHLVGVLADGAATPIASITMDIDGDVRNAATPDIGADEYTPPSCSPPTALLVTPRAFIAIVEWTASGGSTWDIEYGPFGFTPGTGTFILGTTSNPDTLTGLNPTTDYEFYMRENCGATSSPWVGPVAFTTTCAPFVPTFVENFSTWTTAASLPMCWAEYDGVDTNSILGASPATGGAWIYDGFGNNAASPYSVTATTGSASVELWNLGDSDWLVSPEIDLSVGGPYQLDYNWVITNWSTTAASQITGDDYVALYVTNDGGSSWTLLATYDSSTVVTPSLLGETAVFDLTAYSGQTVQFGFWANEGTVDDASDVKFFMDNFRVRPIPTCPEVINVGVDFVSANDVVLSWTNGGSETAWLVEYGAPGFTLGTGTTVLVASNPGMVSGLMPETSYDFYVRAFCAAGDTSSYSFSATATTLCAPVGAGLEDFETVAVGAFGDLGNCWSTSPTTGYRWESENSTGLNENSLNTGPFYDHTLNPVAGGIYMYTEASSGALNDTAYLNSPLVDLSGMTYPRISYWYHMYGVAMGDLLLQINDGSGWTTLSTISGQQQTAGSDDWINVKVNLFDYLNDTVAFRFAGVRGPDFESDMSLDDVAIEEAPANDVAVVAISSPSSTCGMELMPITVTIENLGGADQVYVPVIVELAGAVSGTYTIVLPAIAAGTTETITLDSINTLAGGTILVNAFTALATDEVMSNNAFSTIVEIGAVPMNLPMMDQAICEGSTAQFLNSSLSAEARWILAANDSVLFVGDTFNVAPTVSTAYEVEWFNLATENVGETTPPTAGFTTSTTYYGLRFNANSDFTLNNLTMYPNGTGNVTIALYDESTNTVIDQRTVAVTDGGTAYSPFVAALNWDIPASANPYRLAYFGSLGITNLGRSTSGASFPYSTSNGEVVIYNSATTATTGTSTTAYYWFYDWEVSLSGCPSERTAFNVNVTPSTLDSVDVTACDSMMINGVQESTPGYYTEVLSSTNTGCDSVVVYNLSIINSTTSSSTIDLCFGSIYTLVDGTTVDTAGTYTAVIPNAIGCDSIVTVTINELLPANSAWSDSFCAGSDYTLPSGAVVSSAGIYTDVLLGQASNGCDSIVSVTLTEIAPVTSAQAVDVCNGSSYTLPDGMVVSDAGVYTSTVAAANGCDSIITTTVSLVNTFNVVQNVQICSGDTVFVGSNAYDSTGTYVDVLVSSGGCDSVVTTNLVVFTAINVTIGGVSTVCENLGQINLDLDPIGGVLSGAGVSGTSFDPAIAGVGSHLLSYTFTDQNGCSATASLNVDVVVCTGIDDLEGIETVSIFPNPYLSTINILFNDAKAGELNVKLFDLTGRILLAESFNTALGVNTLKLEVPANIAAGVTMMQLERNGAVFNTTLIKQ
ncbi:MAG: right-handed parallel beta-helix repeat-containing protein [Chitinophagales bacterium]|nr:right-handed parallel beta-helix repeat-containing protein [Chitinophagales bacterium]